MTGAKHVLKILEWDTGYTDRNFDRVRRDALIMERLTGSPYIVNIYSYCGFAQVVELGREGNLDNVIYDPDKPLPGPLKLRLANQVARALADAHDIDGDGRSSISHGDYASKQYIKVGKVSYGCCVAWYDVWRRGCVDQFAALLFHEY